MILERSDDIRVAKTITNIYVAFEELICEYDYNQITVTELAKRAQINKKTFYRYYETLDDLLEELQMRYTQKYLKTIEGAQYPRDLEQGVESFLRYSSSQGEAFDKITTSGSYGGIRQEMINSVMNRTWGQSPEFNRLSEWEKKILLNFVENTGLTLYQEWADDGKEEPIENVIKDTQILMRGGVDKYLQVKEA